ncbi:MAG: glycosyl transferase [Clostridia bacterium]|nr:glycosyl transferase [Clostridia bacterium]
MKNVKNKIKKVIKKPKVLIMALTGTKFAHMISDMQYLKLFYRLKFNKELNLENPQTFNEKMQWIKLYDRKPEYTVMVDKYAVKKYIADKIGEEYVIPLIGVWDKYDDIDFAKLPNQFVLKATHNSGGLFICKDKSKFDEKEVKKIFDRALKQNYYYHMREWPYKNVPPKILAETYMEDKNTETLIVYKVFTFGGVPKIIQVIQNDKKENEAIDYFDTEWNLLDLKQNFENSDNPPTKPQCLQEILRLSGICSDGIPFVRVDWYVINGKLYFSEFTFFSDAGMEPFNPPHWDDTLGSWIELPERK